MPKTESQARDSEVQMTKEGHCIGHHGRAGKRTIQTQTQTQTQTEETIWEKQRQRQTETETETETEAEGKLKKNRSQKYVQIIRFYLSRGSRCGVDPSVVKCALCACGQSMRVSGTQND